MGVEADGVRGAMNLAGESRDLTLTPTQGKFINLPAPKFQAFMGGVGNGKTTAGIIKADLIAEAYPGSRGLVGRQDFTDLSRTTWREFFAWRPDLGKRYHGTSHVLRYPNGSEILFSELSDLPGLMSLNLDWFYVDQVEELCEDAFLALAGRLRGKTGPRLGFMTGNPAGHDWIWKRFKQAVAGGEYALFESPSQENEKNLPSDYLPTLLANAPERWIKRYVYGSWDSFEGLIWPEFIEAIHVVTPFKIPSEWRRIVCVDFGYRHPTAVLFTAEDQDGTLWVYDEYRCTGTRIEDTCREILSRMKAEDVDESQRLRLGDPSMFAEDREDAIGITSVADQFVTHGLSLSRANNDVRGGIDKVAEYLKTQRLKVFRNCIMFREEIGDYQWEKLKGTLLGVKLDPERPRKINDDLCDCARYTANRPFSVPRVHPAREFTSRVP